MTCRDRFLSVAGAVVVVDAVTKMAAVSALGSGTFDAGPLDLRVVRNDGIAFGAASFIPPVVLVLLTLAVTVVLGLAVWRGVLFPGAFSGLLVGGALSNVMDRALGGTVVDMFHLGWWPAFNAADVCIVVGAGGVMLFKVDRRPLGTVGSDDDPVSDRCSTDGGNRICCRDGYRWGASR